MAEQGPLRAGLACKVCLEPLHSRRNLFGEWEPAHPRMFKEYDHEPDPVQASELATSVKYICDYCHGRDPRWLHWGQTGQHDGIKYGDRWAACDVCHQAVKRGHVMGVIRHFLRQEGPNSEAAAMARAQKPEQAFPMLFAFIPTVRWWAPIPDPHHPPRITAGELPKVRARLVRMWRSEVGPQLVLTCAQDGGVVLPGADFDSEEHFQLKLPGVSREGAEQFCQRKANGIDVGSLYWISAEFTELALRAARQMTDLSLAREDLPAPSGLIYFDAPLTELHVEHLSVPIQALSWVLVPGGVWISAYGLADRVYDGNPRMREMLGWLAAWGPGGGMPYGTHSAAAAPNSAALLAVWAIMQQERFAEIRTEQPGGRQSKKKRQHSPTQQPVQVVDIRRRQRTAAERATAAAGRKLSFQMERSGHWKMQAYGTGRALRKRIWVDAYWVGEEGAPVKFKGEQVTRLQ